MAIKIHHGPPGSYKTAGAVNDDLIPALMAGRCIVTNVRGITMETIEEALPDAPIAEIQLIHVDTTTRDGREKFLTWFHWVPVGAFIFIDEAQSIFPKRWKEADLKTADLPHEIAAEQGRPQNWWDAWDMHRHFNWDVVLTTPEIDKIRDDIRGASELAYKHKNLGLYGFLFKGSYNEGIHSKDNGGTTAGHFQAVRGKRIGKNSPVWKLYQSTATGDIKETSAGFNLLSNPRLLIGFSILGYCAFSFATSDTDILGGTIPEQTTADTQKAVPVVPQSGSPSPLDNGFINDASLSDGSDDVVITHPLQDAVIDYSGTFSTGSITKHLFTVYQGSNVYGLNADDLRNMGYKLSHNDYCSWNISYNEVKLHARCRYS